MAGHFDKEEWSFECKRDNRAEQEAAIKDKWQSWADKRLMKGADDNDVYAKSYNEGIKTFANQSAELEINKLK